MRWMIGLGFAALAGCEPPTAAGTGRARAEALPTEVSAAAPDPFAAFLDASTPIADGFSLPVDAGWTPCGDGCWEADAASPVRAIGAGTVISAGPSSLVTRHLWYDDQVRRTAEVRWEGLTTALSAGVELRRGAPLGTATRLVVRLVSTDARDTAAAGLGDVNAFLTGRPRLPVPQAEPALALISKSAQALRLYAAGRPVTSEPLQVGFGQSTGDKERRGDNRTPEGVYHVVGRSRGPFSGDYAAYYGGYWLKLDYPNPWDAARGVDAGLITAEQQRAISSTWWERRVTLQKTALGGGIGLHGWAYEWSDTGPRGMSWGCVVMHLRDAPTIYDALPEGAMVVVF